MGRSAFAVLLFEGYRGDPAGGGDFRCWPPAARPTLGAFALSALKSPKAR